MAGNTWVRYVSLCFIAVTLILSGCTGAAKQPAAGSTPGPADSQRNSESVELTVSAAASLTAALQELKPLFEAGHPQMTLNYNFGASGALQQQIEHGAPTDVFISAAAKNMKTLVDKQLIDASQQTDLLVNELVVIVPSDSAVQVSTLQDLADSHIRHLAIGETQTVPAGSYAKEALTKSGQWEALQAKLVPGKDVRQVLTYVESGNAEAGFVYKTDALTSSKVKLAFSVDPAAYSPIVYPAGLVKAGQHQEEAALFYKYLQSREAQEIFIKHGFSSPFR